MAAVLVYEQLISPKLDCVRQEVLGNIHAQHKQAYICKNKQQFGEQPSQLYIYPYTIPIYIHMQHNQSLILHQPRMPGGFQNVERICARRRPRSVFWLIYANHEIENRDWPNICLIALAGAFALRLPAGVDWEPCDEIRKSMQKRCNECISYSFTHYFIHWNLSWRTNSVFFTIKKVECDKSVWNECFCLWKKLISKQDNFPY